jgi:hypothetical protein
MDLEPAEEPPDLGRVARLLAVAIAVVAVIALAILVVTPDDGLLDTPFDPIVGGGQASREPVWGTPAPMRGDPLEPGACDADPAAADPSDVGAPEHAEAWPDGLVLWLRADRGVVREAEDRVTAWRDLSGAHNDLRVEEGGAAPRFVARAWRCRPALRFTGTGSLGRDDTLGIAADQPRTFVVAARLRDPFERSQLFAQGEAGSLFRHVGIEANTWQTAGERFGVYAVGSSFDGATATHREPSLHVLRVTRLEPGHVLAGYAEDEPALAYRIDGRPRALSLRSGTGSPGEDFTAAARTSVGRFPGPGRFGWRGDVLEVQVYGRALEEPELRAVEGAIGARYDIPIAHPAAANGRG